MGEIMRWRLTREAQRRIPKEGSVVRLGGERWQIDPKNTDDLKTLQSADANNTTFTSYSQTFSSTSNLIQYLSSQSSLIAGLFELDRWLASQDNRPAVSALNTEIARDLGSNPPNPVQWQNVHKILALLFYAALIISALSPPNIILVEILGLLDRWLLVVALVDGVGSLNTPDDVYAALRWRTLVLADWMVLTLLAIRLQKRAVIVRKPGFADLYITREEWDHYEAAEIASIENILKGELKSRVHVLVNQTKVTTTTEVTTTTLKEQDSTTTDLSQLQQQSSSDISIAAHVDGKVDTSGQYGPTQVNTHIGGSLDYSNASATSKATTQSHETVSRAVSKLEQTTRQVRTVSTLTRSTDKEEHTFDNRQQPEGPVVGIYRWVDQIQNVELDRYPHRFLMEFEVPEPGAWTRWLYLKNVSRNMIHQPPVPLTVDGNPVTAANPLLQPKDISGDPTDGVHYYGKFAARYLVTGFSSPPGPLTVAANVGHDGILGDIHYNSDTTLTVPNGYKAASWAASFQYATTSTKALDTQGLIDVAVGGGPSQESGPIGVREPDHVVGQFGPGCPVGPISVGAIPIAMQTRNILGFEVNVEVTCVPLEQTVEQWQNDTYALIVAGYNAMLQAYNDELAGLSVQTPSTLVNANSPAQNVQTVKQELKRQVIEMLIGTADPDPPCPGASNFKGLNAILWNPPNAPIICLQTAANVAPEIQFLEQAFEWETLSYICYPYYWADSRRWPDLAVIEGDDPDFADFLRAGSARVVLAARPGFEDQVNFYVLFGILWGGGPMPAPGDEGYLSIADEIKAQQQRPLDVTVIDTWQVRLPTTLIWLENSDGLPKNPNPTIDTTPKIVNLTPASGKVGTLVTIAGRNFGDIVGRSTVSFNGMAATPTRWSATSIEVNVPTGAATGDVNVSVGGVSSNGMNFTVK